MVYIYQSCSPLATFSTKVTQVIQTERVSITDYPGLIFKDKTGICWTYLDRYEDNYIPPSNVFNVTHQGNIFENDSMLNQIYYHDCDSCFLTQVSGCTEIYFSAERCDDKTNVVVKECNVGPTVGTLKLTHNVGDVCGVMNPNGDDFCVTLNTQIYNVDTEYEIITPAWKYYDCDSCPTHKTYSVNSIDNLVQDFKVFAPTTSDTLLTGTSVNLNVSDLCYLVSSYDGIKINYLYNSDTDPTINQVFTTSADCMINYYNTII